MKPVVRYFKMQTAAENINKKVEYILSLHKKLPEPLQSKHNDIIKQVSEESKEINDIVNIEKGNNEGNNQQQLMSSPKTRKFIGQITPRKRWQLATVKRPASPLNSRKRLSGKYSLFNLKDSASALFKFKLSSEVKKYHQLYEDFIALEGSKIRRVVRFYEMSRIAENLNKKCDDIMNIRQQLPEQEQSINDAIIKQVLNNHARIQTIINSEEEELTGQKLSTPKRKMSDYLSKRRNSKRDSTPRKIAKDVKLKTPKKTKSYFPLAKKLFGEFSSNSPKEIEESKQSKLHDLCSYAVLKLKRKETELSK